MLKGDNEQKAWKTLSPKCMSDEESDFDEDTGDNIFINHSPSWRSEGMVLVNGQQIVCISMHVRKYKHVYSFIVLKKFIKKLDRRLGKLPRQKGFQLLARKKGIEKTCSVPPNVPAWAVYTASTMQSDLCPPIPPINTDTPDEEDLHEEDFDFPN